jgi:hypothetical protein
MAEAAGDDDRAEIILAPGEKPRPDDVILAVIVSKHAAGRPRIPGRYRVRRLRAALGQVEDARPAGQRAQNREE